jgi:ribonuclease P protein component
VLPAKNRMTRSAEFGATVKHGVRAVQPDLVVHARQEPDRPDGPRIGLIVTKSVGNAVERHRVSRRLRHAARSVIGELDPVDRLVIRALPSSRHAMSERLQHEVAAGVRRAQILMGVS